MMSSDVHDHSTIDARCWWPAVRTAPVKTFVKQDSGRQGAFSFTETSPAAQIESVNKRPPPSPINPKPKKTQNAPFGDSRKSHALRDRATPHERRLWKFGLTQTNESVKVLSKHINRPHGDSSTRLTEVYLTTTKSCNTSRLAVEMQADCMSRTVRPSASHENFKHVGGKCSN